MSLQGRETLDKLVFLKLNFRKDYNENTCNSYITLVAFLAAWQHQLRLEVRVRAELSHPFRVGRRNVYQDCGRSQTICDQGYVNFIMSDPAFKQQ